jgi:putative transposase
MNITTLSERQWAFFQQFLPKQHMGRPRLRDRECLNAIIYVLETGCQWNKLPDTFPPPVP